MWKSSKYGKFGQCFYLGDPSAICTCTEPTDMPSNYSKWSKSVLRKLINTGRDHGRQNYHSYFPKHYKCTESITGHPFARNNEEATVEKLAMQPGEGGGRALVLETHKGFECFVLYPPQTHLSSDIFIQVCSLDPPHCPGLEQWVNYSPILNQRSMEQWPVWINHYTKS